jgi:hypothetical protein
MQNLKRLDLRGTRITDDSLALLSVFPSLNHMDLSETAVTDKGLLYLRALSLTKVLLQETVTTPEGRTRLRCRTLPIP